MDASAAVWTGAQTDLGYLAKDYRSFRRLMLDRIAALAPAALDDQPADLLVTLVELLAYRADHVSYFQDAAATEAYLGTARRRSSIRRHALLLDYQMHEGCNARTYLGYTLGPSRDRVAVGPTWTISSAGDPPVRFVPMHRPVLHRSWNEIELEPGRDDAEVSVGATSAAVAMPDPALRAGDLVALVSDDRIRAHVVRLTGVGDQRISWSAQDAPARPIAVRAGGRRLGHATANVVLADAGDAGAIDVRPPRPGSNGLATRWALDLPGPLTWSVDVAGDLTSAPAGALTTAAALLLQDPRDARPAVTLHGRGDPWAPVRDLLSSTGSERSFVVEVDDDGASVRFGDGAFGRRPPDSAMTAHVRIGNGGSGNVAGGRLTVLRSDEGDTDDVTVVNLVPGSGGTDAESAEEVRRFAPSTFNTNRRAVTAADYAALAQRFPGVQRAAAALRWTGSWHTAFVHVDREHGLPVDGPFRRELLAYLDPYRLAGCDVVVEGAVPVPVALSLAVRSAPGAFAAAVDAALRDRFCTGERAFGGSGFFHPDEWTLGQPVYLSRVVAAAVAVPGVATVEVTRFERVATSRRAPLDQVLTMAADEAATLGSFDVVVLDDD